MGVEATARRILDGDVSPLLAYDSASLAAILRCMREMAETGRSDTAERIRSFIWERQPVSVDQFLDDPYYMGGEDLLRGGTVVYPKWREELKFILDPSNGVYEWILEGAIGIGKTLVATIAILYKLYELTCMRNPQLIFRLDANTQLYFAFFNITVELAKKVGYSSFQKQLVKMPYFQSVCQKPDRQLTRSWTDVTRVKFPKGIGMALGSNIGHALGQAVYSGMLDEANFGRIDSESKSAAKGQVFGLYNATRARYKSRFAGKPLARGLLCLISSKQSEASFLEAHKELVKDEIGKGVHVSSFAQWEVKTEFDKSPRFWVMTGDQTSRPSMSDDRPPEEEVRGDLFSVPVDFKEEFQRDIDVAIRDLAGRSTYGSYPLIAFRDRVVECIDPDRQHPWEVETILLGLLPPRPKDLPPDAPRPEYPNPLIEGFAKNKMLTMYDEVRRLWRPSAYPAAQRFIHVDLARKGDACGISMGAPVGVKTVARVDNKQMPFRVLQHSIYMDFMLRIKNQKGSEINFEQIVEFIQWLSRSGYPIRQVSYDSFQSTHSMQILSQAGFNVKYISVDRTAEPYMELKAAMYEGRLSYYRYQPFIDNVTHVQYDSVRQKVDHTAMSEKDVSDSVAGVIHGIMHDPDYSRPSVEVAVPVRPGKPAELMVPVGSVLVDEPPAKFDDYFG